MYLKKFDLTGRRAYVTGGGRAIGLSCCEALAEAGAHVIIGDISEGVAEEGRDYLKSKGYSADIDIMDVTNTDQVRASAEKMAKQGGVDILVNNAGIMSCASIADTDDDAFEKQVAVNLGGVFRGMRSAANQLRDGGRIISFSSSVVGLYQPTYGVYAATKAAVEALTHVLAKELGPRGITVNAVAPGPVATDFFLKGKSDQLIENITAMNPFKRLGQPDEITNVVSFLASEQGGWISGQTIRANGGVI